MGRRDNGSIALFSITIFADRYVFRCHYRCSIAVHAVVAVDDIIVVIREYRCRC